MLYYSTRDAKKQNGKTASYAIKQGLCEDGGLFMPETLPHYSEERLRSFLPLSYPERAAKILADLPEPAPQADDFAVCVRTRRPFAVNETTGFRSATMFNLGIAAERLGRGFRFNPETLHAVDDPAADRFLYQHMREPWATEFMKG